MPISKDKRALYPSNWAQLSLATRARSGGRCECEGECGTPHDEPRCTALNGQPHPFTGSKVVLTAAHVDHDPTNDDPANLRAFCQRCHLAYDRDQHRASAADTRARKADAASGQQRLLR